MMLSTGIGAEVQRPLATVVFFGMVCDTFLTMLALPVLYLLFGKGPKIEAGPRDDDRRDPEPEPEPGPTPTADANGDHRPARMPRNPEPVGV